MSKLVGVSPKQIKRANKEELFKLFPELKQPLPYNVLCLREDTTTRKFSKITQETAIKRVRELCKPLVGVSCKYWLADTSGSRGNCMFSKRQPRYWQHRVRYSWTYPTECTPTQYCLLKEAKK